MWKNRPLLEQIEWTPEEFSELAHVKRFMERYHGDPRFRERLPQEGKSLAEEHGIGIDPMEVRALWDEGLVDEPEALKAGLKSRLVVNYQKWIGDRLRWRDAIRAACEPQEPTWKAWRERQIRRAYNEMGEGWGESIIFDTAAIELSKGCSVGCWFCGVDAPRLEDHLYFNEENAELFTGVVGVLSDLVGNQSSANHFLYWASDPLDNPDYEDYCKAFKEKIGVYPLTTTALAMKDVDRTRRILSMLLEDPTGVHRFSVLTLKLLNRIHEAFTPEELMRIELVLLNKESKMVKANAGRFRTKVKDKPKLLAHEESKVARNKERVEKLGELQDYAGPGSIACVTGLLLNLVDKTAKLITPCKASDRWPLGYVVFAEGSFEDAESLRTLVQSWASDSLQVRLPSDEIVRFRSDLEVEIDERGFKVYSPHGGGKFSGGKTAYYHDLGTMIQEGTHQASSIADHLLAKHGVFHNVTFEVLDWLFDNGLLHDEPDPPAAVEHLVQLAGVSAPEAVAAPA